MPYHFLDILNVNEKSLILLIKLIICIIILLFLQFIFVTFWWVINFVKYIQLFLVNITFEWQHIRSYYLFFLCLRLLSDIFLVLYYTFVVLLNLFKLLTFLFCLFLVLKHSLCSKLKYIWLGYSILCQVFEKKLICIE